ncbi:MAG: suppressor of fused domain protein [Lawsonibacter sp.]|nr:suppressor of fused domain protein [Lawsonibacter sp.]
MDDLLEKLEQWNEADEYTRCIEAIEAVPAQERGYQLTLLLGRAYSNLAVLGDSQERRGEDDEDVDQGTLAHALEIFESIREEGENDPYWYSRVAYAVYMAEDREAEALEYAKKWLALDPENENARQLVDDCVDYLRQEDRRELFAHLDLYGQGNMDTVEAHIEAHFGKFDWIMHETKPGEYVHLDICVIPPGEEHSYYTLVTVGMGAYAMNAPQKEEARAELLINLPRDWRVDEGAWEDEHWFWPVGILKALARYPMTHNTCLGWGHTVYGSEESYADNTKLCGVMLLSPGAFDDRASVCTLLNGETVNFYQVVPLYREEIEFKRKYGADRLLEKFPDRLLEVIDPVRPNVITGAESAACDDTLTDKDKFHRCL